MDCLKRAVRRLNKTDATFVAVRNGRIMDSHDRGIAPIMALVLADTNALRGACVADKVIGKAAALLLVRAGVERLFANTISEHAMSLLSEYHLTFEFGQSVPYIMNRAGDGMCPMESLVLEVNDPEEAFRVLRDRTRT
ncbi:MAG: DUF1893 domain-containing protein [Clostridiaceae bacterium]|jgi:iron complex outermembrane receptor protein|nr:DUF1893 domain-containing protein [Clostridiaceae bacterium]